MGKLGAFLKPVPAGKTKEIFLERFQDEEGNIVPIIVKSISPRENEEITKRFTGKNGVLDAIEYGKHLMVACVAEPNLKDAELCKFYGVMDPADVPGVMFTIGEKQVIQDAITEINDLKMAKSMMDEAKNS